MWIKYWDIEQYKIILLVPRFADVEKYNSYNLNSLYDKNNENNSVVIAITAIMIAENLKISEITWIMIEVS